MDSEKSGGGREEKRRNKGSRERGGGRGREEAHEDLGRITGDWLCHVKPPLSTHVLSLPLSLRAAQ